MKRLTFILVLCLFVTAPVLADLFGGGTFYWGDVKLDGVAQVKLGWGVATNAAFGVTLVTRQLPGSIYASASPANTVLFRTFCVENNIYFTPGTTYWASIDPVAYSGNVGPAGDPISNVTEYIYDRYLTAHPVPTDVATLTSIRDAIWWAEGEGGSKNEIYDNALDAVKAMGDADHTYALNLWTIAWDSGDSRFEAIDVQTQLITMVPIPAAVLLGMLGLGAAGLKLRKFV